MPVGLSKVMDGIDNNTRPRFLSLWHDACTHLTERHYVTDAVPLPQKWKEHFAENLAYATAEPYNGFEEAIKLTKEGKLWKFPIDNEQGEDLTDFVTAMTS